MKVPGRAPGRPGTAGMAMKVHVRLSGLATESLMALICTDITDPLPAASTLDEGRVVDQCHQWGLISVISDSAYHRNFALISPQDAGETVVGLVGSTKPSCTNTIRLSK